MLNEIDTLNTDYKENVLIHLFQNSKDIDLHDYSCGFGPNSYNLKIDFKSILKNAPKYLTNGNKFIHFTSFKSLYSILSENAIRMYDLTCMDDPSEFNFLASEFGFDKSKTKYIKENIFIFSMCHIDLIKSNNILNLWRLYGKNGDGCAIEFEIKNPIYCSSDIKLAKIIYNKSDYTEFHKANSEFEDRWKRKVDVIELIKSISILHKNPLYSTEKEIRLFYEHKGEIIPDLIEDYPEFGFDVDDRHKLKKYKKVSLYKDERDFPNIKINKILLGYKSSITDLENIRENIFKYYINIISKLTNKIELPTIEISPLKDFFGNED